MMFQFKKQIWGQDIDVILGMNWIAQHEAIIDTRKHTIPINALLGGSQAYIVGHVVQELSKIKLDEVSKNFEVEKEKREIFETEALSVEGRMFFYFYEIEEEVIFYSKIFTTRIFSLIS
ncbi:hypothetical protein ACJX0J_007678 [Zea mays]